MAHIVDLTLEASVESSGRISSVGHVFAEGHLREGQTLAATHNGSAVDVQTDVLATWNDGSVKHAVVTFEAPSNASSAPLVLSSVQAPQDAPLALDVVLAEAGYAFEIEVDGETVDVADLIASQPGDLWLNGSLAVQTRVTTTLANGLDLRIDVTAKADGTIDTSVTVANDDIDTTDLATFTYDYAVRQQGVTVLAGEGLAHPHHTVWRESFSTGETADTAHVLYDLDYLRGTGLLPSVDETLALTDGAIYGARFDDPNATFDPMELGGVDNTGGIDPDRGRTGTTPSYGLLTDDQHSYLVTQTRDAREGMLGLTDQYGAFSNNYRNPETGEAYFLEDVDFNSSQTGTGKDVTGTGGVVDLQNDGLAQRNSTSHKPSEYYLSYLITGDRYYAEGLAGEAGSPLFLWANANYLTEHGAVDFGSQLREQTAVLRDLFYAASLAPDGTHAETVLNVRLDGALDDYVAYYIERDGPLTNQHGAVMTGERTGPHFVGGDFEGVLQSYGGTAVDRPYWQDWFGMVIGQIAATGDARAHQLGEWMAGFSAERFLQDDFDPRHELYSIVAYPAGSSLDIASDATWADLNAAAEAHGALDSDLWSGGGFYAASAWGGTAALFSGIRDARYAEALLWMTGEITEDYVAEYMLRGATAQFAVPVTFADNTIAGVTDRTVGTNRNDVISDDGGAQLINAGDGHDNVTTGAGAHLVEGGDGDDRLTGGAGEDWLFGGSGQDILRGGAGLNYLQGDRHDEDFGRAADLFVFDGALGETTIGDFTIGEDHLVFNGVAGGMSSGEIIAGFTQTSDGAALDLGAQGRLVLSGVHISDLSQSDVIASTETNTNPVARSDAGLFAFTGETLMLEHATLLANDRDADSDPLSIDWVSDLRGGTVTLDGSGTIRFEVSDSFNGTASFDYGIGDGLGGRSSARVSITIHDPADGPPLPQTVQTITGPGPHIHGGNDNDRIVPADSSARTYGHGGDDLVELYGGLGHTHAGNGDDVILMAASNHVVTGGLGADAFALAGETIQGRIRDFTLGEDTLYIANGIGGLDSWEAVEASLSQHRLGAMLRTDAGRLILHNIDMTALSEDSIMFYGNGQSSAIIPPETGDPITGPGWLNGTAANDMLLSGSGNIRLYGDDGDDHLIAEHWNVRMLGGDGDDLIEARDHSALVYGGAGADTIWFTAHLDGTLFDFAPEEDRLALNADLVGGRSAAQVFADLYDTAEGARLDGAGDTRILFNGLTVEDLSPSDFLIV